jgi:hypothetical protein
MTVSVGDQFVSQVGGYAGAMNAQKHSDFS